MEIATQLRLVNDSYNVSVGLAADPGATPLTPAEVQAFQEFGDQVVECGGTIGSGEGAFTLPTNPLRFPSQFPVIQTFSVADLTLSGAQAQAAAWRTQIQTLIIAARDALMSRSVGSTGRTLTTSIYTP